MKCIIYTDGSSTLTKANPTGDGGYAYVILDNNKNEVYRCYNKYRGTSAACELMAGLSALEWAVENNYTEAKIYSDSTYFVNSYNSWIHGWNRRNWKSRSYDEVANVDIMKNLFKVKAKIKSSAVHVRGHNGNQYNELVDELANKARQENG
ncbi:MAG: ribonuclease HI [Saprospiraceae bacterium]|nr:ribonuclease HI [Saprospiraceae bacterium]